MSAPPAKRPRQDPSAFPLFNDISVRRQTEFINDPRTTAMVTFVRQLLLSRRIKTADLCLRLGVSLEVLNKWLYGNGQAQPKLPDYLDGLSIGQFEAMLRPKLMTIPTGLDIRLRREVLVPDKSRPPDANRKPSVSQYFHIRALSA